MAQPAAGRRLTHRSLGQSHLARIVNNSPPLKLNEYQLLNAYRPMDECSYPLLSPARSDWIDQGRITKTLCTRMASWLAFQRASQLLLA
jgi:hypothetical protein